MLMKSQWNNTRCSFTVMYRVPISRISHCAEWLIDLTIWMMSAVCFRPKSSSFSCYYTIFIDILECIERNACRIINCLLSIEESHDQLKTNILLLLRCWSWTSFAGGHHPKPTFFKIYYWQVLPSPSLPPVVFILLSLRGNGGGSHILNAILLHSNCQLESTEKVKQHTRPLPSNNLLCQ